MGGEGNGVSQGSRFVLHAGKDSVVCQTRLLGAHNIQNILLAASVCLELHMTLAQVARGIGKLEPVEHRLQLIPSAGGTTVIDDAFNSNPRGAEAALNVLKDFPGRRIIVTPGMVELGTQEAEFNRELGRFMADKTDLAILVGKKHTRPIAEGLVAAGFPEEKIYPVGSLREATEKLGALGLPGTWCFLKMTCRTIIARNKEGKIPMSKLQLGVFFGSRSCEREVSIISALQMMNHVDTEKYDVVPVYIDQDGAWYTGPALRSCVPLRPSMPMQRAWKTSIWTLPAARERCWPTGLARGCLPRQSWRSLPGWTYASWCCTACMARMARCRGCWKWQTCPIPPPAWWAAPWAWTKSS